MQFVYDDGGRAAAGFKGDAGDCVTRAIAIATGQDYQTVYAAMANGNAEQRITKRSRTSHGKRTARSGISVQRKWFKDYMTALGWKWTPTMGIGTGCTVHLHDGELPMGRLIVSVSKHYTTVIDGVIRDTFDPQREEKMHWYTGDRAGTTTVSRRCVYGYWRQA